MAGTEPTVVTRRRRAAPEAPLPPEVSTYEPTLVPRGRLTPHPKNYRAHPPEQLEHIVSSIQQLGIYRNVVVARDYTILAGHGVVLACGQLGVDRVPVIRLDLDAHEPRALKVLALDNELGRFAVDDDRALTELLREINEHDPLALLGTGYDEGQLAALLMTTRPASEIRDFDEAAEWLGMPEYETEPDRHRLVVCFDTFEDKEKFIKKNKLKIAKKSGLTSTAWWPPRDRTDLKAVKFVPGETEPAEDVAE